MPESPLQAAPDNAVKVIDSRITRKPLPLVRGAGQAYAVLWPENGAAFRTFNIIELGAGSTTRDLSHASECIYYVERGAGLIRDLGDDSTQPLIEGAMLHIGAGDAYRIEASAPMHLIGGCVPVDPALYDLLAEQETAS